MQNNIIESPTSVQDYVLDTMPPMTVGDVLNVTDGVYFCIKNEESVFLWVNENFAALFGKTPEDFIGKQDEQEAHVQHDKEVMANGVPLLNFNETILIPTEDGGVSELEIVTQKGLLRKKGGAEIIGITVCFSLRYPNPEEEAENIIKTLNMEEIDLGGYFAPGFTSDLTLLESTLPERFDGDRQAYSTNYYLLQSDHVLELHSLNQDEQWFFQEGSAIVLHIFETNGTYSSVILGSDIDGGQNLQAIAPHNSWFGAEILGPGYALSSCSLAPSWDQRDSFKPSPYNIASLMKAFPDQVDVIKRLTSI